MSVAPEPALRLPEPTDLEVATGRLIIALREIHAGPPIHPRLAAIMALTAVHDFIADAGVLAGLENLQIDDLRAPLTSLAGALSDLERGSTTPPIFAPNRSGGRPPDGVGRAMLKGAAATAMSVLMEQAGLGRKEAAKLVVKRLSSEGVKLNVKEDWRTVAAWRDQVRRKSKANSENDAAEVYREYMRDASNAAKKVGFPTKPANIRERNALCELLLNGLSHALARGAG